MNDFDQQLQQQLNAIREEGLYRELRRVDSPQGPHVQVAGKAMLNFASNDYLGLANDPEIKEAACKAIEKYGTGSGASRLICGSLAPHHELEESLASFKGAAAALSFSSGYATALGTIGALLEKEDVIVLDKLVHASIVDAARLCGAKLRVFTHNDLNDLEEILKWADNRGPASAGRKQRVLIVTESVFSMDGDLTPLREIIELKDRYGAWLMLDEAHATGLFGANRRGLAEAFEVADRVEIQMSTLGKALGSAGGYICGSRSLIDLLINRARSFIFSTAPSPGAAAAANAAIQIIKSSSGEARRQRLWWNVDQVKNGLISAPWNIAVVRSPIIPIIVGESSKAVALSAELAQLGILIPAIRYPTVARDEARLRLTLSAAHNSADIAALLGAFELCKARATRPACA
jgi:8-amino-7-oxononanoate synthase